MRGLRRQGTVDARARIQQKAGVSQAANALVIAAEFNKPLIDAMVAAASDELALSSTRLVDVVRVPGCYELPLTCSAALALPGVDLVVVLGYIERGETQHGEVMGHVVHRALLELELAHKKPLGLGIIGPGATPAQAELRKDGYARAAVRAALAARAALAKLR